MKKTDLKNLTPLQYQVTQCSDTETPFDNEFWNHKEEGIYVDIVSHEPLFASIHKYDSHTGWPSFYQAIEPNNIVEKADHTLMRARIEVRSKHGDSHLGHVFDDGPQPTGIRYCINSAALRFVPKEKMAEEGYGQYLSLFATHTEEAYFAGGCFWCVEADFMKLTGVLSATSGYSGGYVANPTYEQVCSGTTNHAEAVKIVFDAQKISFLHLLKIYWLSIDPTVKNQQFCDHGTQYRTIIFYRDAAQKELIEQSRDWLKNEYPDLPIVTEIIPFKEFYPAESYHQNYCRTHPERYQSYRQSCGRDSTLQRLYGEKRLRLVKKLLTT